MSPTRAGDRLCKQHGVHAIRVLVSTVTSKSCCSGRSGVSFLMQHTPADSGHQVDPSSHVPNMRMRRIAIKTRHAEPSLVMPSEQELMELHFQRQDTLHQHAARLTRRSTFPLPRGADPRPAVRNGSGPSVGGVRKLRCAETSFRRKALVSKLLGRSSVSCARSDGV
jgi:hypothetical protein